MGIVWREQLSVGHPVIDEDHRSLIAIINEFETVFAGTIDTAKLQSIAKKLYTYAHSHFEREEKIQLTCKYPYHDAHHREHEALLKQLEAWIKKVFIERSVPVNHESAEELSNFLKSWLVDHIIKNDLRMKGHVG